MRAANMALMKLPHPHLSPQEKKRIEWRLLIIGIAVTLGLLLAAGFVTWQIKANDLRKQELQRTALHPTPLSVGGAFTLVNQDGKTVHDTDYRGKYLLIYFGYSFCPDMCPTGLQSIARTLDLLGHDIDKVQALFVTIDPVRDTPAKLKAYCATFHPKIVGLTGSADQIASIAKNYQVYYAKQSTDDPRDDQYIMDHSSLIYLMDPTGKFLTSFPEEVDPKALVAALSEAIGKKPISNGPIVKTP